MKKHNVTVENLPDRFACAVVVGFLFLICYSSRWVATHGSFSAKKILKLEESMSTGSPDAGSGRSVVTQFSLHIPSCC